MEGTEGRQPLEMGQRLEGCSLKPRNAGSHKKIQEVGRIVI